MKDDGFKEFVLDQLRDGLAVDCRTMFGGFGMYGGGSFFGIIFQGRLYFKVSAETIAEYQESGAKPFQPCSLSGLEHSHKSYSVSGM